MDGRVKTLHPKVHGGLLAVRDNADHQAAAAEHAILPIDLLAVSLYPFEETLAAGGDFDALIENIDIGGPAMIRAAAKNHDGVTVIVDPADYDRVVSELQNNDGATSLELRRALAAKAYARTASYDAAISTWMAEATEQEAPVWRNFAGRLAQVTRYGENPHQKAALYVSAEQRAGVANAIQHQGKELSYNNFNDTDAAFELVAEFSPEQGAAVAIIKHANPCGVAVGASLKEAYLAALRCDPVSAFGGRLWQDRDIVATTVRDTVELGHDVEMLQMVSLPDVPLMESAPESSSHIRFVPALAQNQVEAIAAEQGRASEVVLTEHLTAAGVLRLVPVRDGVVSFAYTDQHDVEPVHA